VDFIIFSKKTIDYLIGPFNLVLNTNALMWNKNPVCQHLKHECSYIELNKTINTLSKKSHKISKCLENIPKIGAFLINSDLHSSPQEVLL